MSQNLQTQKSQAQPAYKNLYHRRASMKDHKYRPNPHKHSSNFSQSQPQLNLHANYHEAQHRQFNPAFMLAGKGNFEPTSNESGCSSGQQMNLTGIVSSSNQQHHSSPPTQNFQVHLPPGSNFHLKRQTQSHPLVNQLIPPGTSSQAAPSNIHHPQTMQHSNSEPNQEHLIHFYQHHQNPGMYQKSSSQNLADSGFLSTGHYSVHPSQIQHPPAHLFPQHMPSSDSSHHPSAFHPPNHHTRQNLHQQTIPAMQNHQILPLHNSREQLVNTFQPSGNSNFEMARNRQQQHQPPQPFMQNSYPINQMTASQHQHQQQHQFLTHASVAPQATHSHPSNSNPSTVNQNLVNESSNLPNLANQNTTDNFQESQILAQNRKMSAIHDTTQRMDPTNSQIPALLNSQPQNSQEPNFSKSSAIPFGLPQIASNFIFETVSLNFSELGRIPDWLKLYIVYPENWGGFRLKSENNLNSG